MRGRATEVDARYRRARREPSVPHLVGQALALEDVPTGEPDARFDVGRPEHLPVDDAVGHVGREARDRGEGRVGDLVAPLVPRPGGERRSGTNWANTLIV